MNSPNEIVEIVYSLQEDLAGKYLQHNMKIGDVKNNVQKLYYMKVQEAWIHLMPDKELLHFSTMIDSELNLRYGSREFAMIKDS